MRYIIPQKIMLKRTIMFLVDQGWLLQFAISKTCTNLRFHLDAMFLVV